MSQNLLEKTSVVVKLKITFEVRNFSASSNENYLVRIDGILNATIFTDHNFFIFLGKP